MCSASFNMTIQNIHKTHLQDTSRLYLVPKLSTPPEMRHPQVIVNETNNTTAPTSYISNLNTVQQELLCLHETYAHADMK
jgi:hypothetical protein